MSFNNGEAVHKSRPRIINLSSQTGWVTRSPGGSASIAETVRPTPHLPPTNCLQRRGGVGGGGGGAALFAIASSSAGGRRALLYERIIAAPAGAASPAPSAPPRNYNFLLRQNGRQRGAPCLAAIAPLIKRRAPPILAGGLYLASPLSTPATVWPQRRRIIRAAAISAD